MQKQIDARVIKSKNRLKAALLTLMKQKKFEKINVCEICDFSGVHRMTFYNHYADKYALFSDAINDIKTEIRHRYNQEMLLNSNKSPVDQTISIFEIMTSELNKYYPIFESIMSSECCYELYNLIHHSFEEGLSELSYQIFKDNNDALNLKIKFFIGGIGHLLTHYMYYKDQVDYHLFIDCLKQIINNFYTKN